MITMTDNAMKQYNKVIEWFESQDDQNAVELITYAWGYTNALRHNDLLDDYEYLQIFQEILKITKDL